jgi:transcriptional regulator with XRE-family HTH domain
MRRLMLEMSQATLADALGLTFQQVQKYEKGATPDEPALDVAKHDRLQVEADGLDRPPFDQWAGLWFERVPEVPDEVEEAASTCDRLPMKRR